MAYIGENLNARSRDLPDPTISSFDLSLCTPAEQAFIHGCRLLEKGSEVKALREFRVAARRAPDFLDAWFMAGFLSLCRQDVHGARQAFLQILQKEEPLLGTYILRFLPTFRPQANLYEGFFFQIMPTTADVAAVAARLYLVEGKKREAKKIIHPAFLQYHDNSAVQAVWAQSMIADGNPGDVIEKVDRNIPYHQGYSDLDVLVTFVIGHAYFAMGDFRNGIYHWESTLHHAMNKNPVLMDYIRIRTAQAYESRGYLLDAMETLSSVEDKSIEFDDIDTVSIKVQRLKETVNAHKREGIIKAMKFSEEHEYKQIRDSHGFLEVQRPGETGS
jgi:hypothetical protein